VTAAGYDATFQCFGTCVQTEGSEGNTSCGGKPSHQFEDDIFAQDTDCIAQNEANDKIKAGFKPSCAKVCPQYTSFIEHPNNSCVEPEPHPLCIPKV